LIIGSRHAWLWCLNAKTGDEIWKYNYWWSWVESSPVIENGTIFIGSSDLRRVLAIDLQTGKTRWKLHTSGYPYTKATLNQSTVYMGSMESDPEGKKAGFIYLLNNETGTLKEKIAIPEGKQGYLNGIHGDIAVGKDCFYAASLGGKIMAFRK
jgi:outer membrane protein assembly factor BamB